MTTTYVDSSALVKRLVEEAESDEFERFLVDRLGGGDTLVSSAITTVELHRFAIREGISPANVTAVVRNVARVDVSRRVLAAAASIRAHVKTLDAVHLGTALTLRDDVRADDGLDALVTYDAAMARAGHHLGFEVIAPRA